VRVVLRDGDGETRIVKDVLEGEDVAVDDEGGDAAGVDGFEGTGGPASERRESASRRRGKEKWNTHQAGIPRGSKQNLLALSVPRYLFPGENC